MVISGNQTDTERPSTMKTHDGEKQHDEDKKLDQDKKNDTDEEPRIGPPDEGPQKTPIRPASSGEANTDTDSPPSSRSKKSVASSKSGASSSSDGSIYDRYSVQPNALRLYRGSVYTRGDLPEVHQGSLEHQEMRDCVNLAMCILSRTRNRNAMAVYSIGLVGFMKKERNKSTAGVFDFDGDKMPNMILQWLDFLRNQFPNLYISPSLGPYYAYTLRADWGTDFKDFSEYMPRSAALISIHFEPFQRMCRLKERMAEYMKSYTQQWLPKLTSLKDDRRKARESKDTKLIAAAEIAYKNHREICNEMEKFSRNYRIHHERSLFHIAATLAHECFHVLTGLWTRFAKEITPPSFFGASEDPQEGEAGEWWAYKYGFGGAVHLVWNKTDKKKDDPYPLPVEDEHLSAGIPFLKHTRYGSDGSADGEVWTRISHAYIRDFIKKGASDEPIRASGAEPIDDEDFAEEFACVIQAHEAGQSTTTSPGRSSKAEPQSIFSEPAGDRIVCEDCGPGAQAVPLGCRGPKPTASPQA